ncbi:MAG: hypothetical protein KDD94_13350, partial [Calditrichaeota bacterium]|nr:hypothetical protein [Calditrichota bacterium]
GFYKGFKDLFADFKYTHGKELSLNKLKKRYDQLSYEYGYPVDIPASIILLNAQDQIFMAQPDLAKELIDAYEQQHGKTNQSGRLQFQLADLIANPPTETRSEILNSPQPEAKQMQPFLGDWQGKVQDHFPYEVVVHLTTGNSGFTGWIKIGRPDGQEGEETKLIYIRRIDETTIEFGYENLKRPFSALNAFRAQIRNGEMTGETSFIGIKVPPAMAGNDFSRTFKLKRINSN